MPITSRRGAEEYSIQLFQKPHKEEYTISSMKNGEVNGVVQLFRYGILQASWKEQDGKRTGIVTKYKGGVVDCQHKWSDLHSFPTTSLPGIVNTKSGRKLGLLYTPPNDSCSEISPNTSERQNNDNQAYYLGEYNDNWQPDGYGIYYVDKKEVHAGFYKEGKLIHYHQIFEDIVENGTLKRIMIEFDGNPEEDNVSDVLLLQPVYMGSYLYDEDKHKFLKHGIGNAIGKTSGICEYIGEWEKDILKPSPIWVLYDGWFTKAEGDKSLRCEMDKNYMSESIIVFPGFSQARGIKELTISGNNDISNEIRINSFPDLKKLEVQPDSLKKVRVFIVDGLPNLITLIIGDHSLRINSYFEVNDARRYYRGDGVFRVTNCHALTTIEIGDRSCCDYTTFDISNLSSLDQLSFGCDAFWYANLTLRGLCFALSLFL